MTGYPKDEEHGGVYENRFETTEKRAMEAYTYADDTLTDLEARGLTGRPRPKMGEAHQAVFPKTVGRYYEGHLPPVLKTLSMAELSTLLTLTCNWYGYVSAQHTMIMVQRSEKKRRQELMKAMLRRKHHAAAKAVGINLSDQKLRDTTAVDSRFVQVDAEYEAANVEFSAIDALLEVAKNDMKVVSREVTIREAQIEAEARGRGFGNGSRFSPPPEAENRRAVSAKAKPKTPPKARRGLRRRVKD